MNDNTKKMLSLTPTEEEIEANMAHTWESYTYHKDQITKWLSYIHVVAMFLIIVGILGKGIPFVEKLSSVPSPEKVATASPEKVATASPEKVATADSQNKERPVFFLFHVVLLIIFIIASGILSITLHHYM